MTSQQFLPRARERMGKITKIEGNFGEIREHQTKQMFPFSVKTGVSVGVNNFGPYLDGKEQEHEWKVGDDVIFYEEGQTVARLAPKRLFDQKAASIPVLPKAKVVLPGRKPFVMVGHVWVLRQILPRRFNGDKLNRLEISVLNKRNPGFGKS